MLQSTNEPLHISIYYSAYIYITARSSGRIDITLRSVGE